MNESWTKKSRDDVSLKNVLKELSGRERMEYLWEYYKVPILLVALGLIILAFSVAWIFSRKTTYFTVELVNVSGSYYEMRKLGTDIFQDYLRKEGLDPNKYNIDVIDSRAVDLENMDTNTPATLQIMTAEFSSGSFDLFVADEPVWEFYAPYGAVMDLRDVLPKDWLEAHKDLWYMITMEETGEEILAGIYAKEGSRFMSQGCYVLPKPMGIAIHCKDPEKIGKFIMWAAE